MIEVVATADLAVALLDMSSGADSLGGGRLVE